MIDGIALEDHVDERLGRSVQNRGFTRVDFDQHIVDAAAVQRTQHMLNLVDLRVAGRDRGVANQVGDQINARANLGLPTQIDTLKCNALASWSRFHRQRDRFAGVEPSALDRHLSRESTLFHKNLGRSLGNAP
jgi:hypothetical protein